MTFVMRKIVYTDIENINSWKVKNFSMDIYYKNYKNTGQLLGPDNSIAFILTSNKDIVGLIEYYFDENKYATISILRNPDLKWKDCGKIILEKGIKTLKNNLYYKKTYIKAWVSIFNIPALNLLNNFGFIKESNPLFNINKRILFYYYC